MIHLFSDPRPDLPDTQQWTIIFRDMIPYLPIKQRADLASMLSTMRDMGTMIRITHLETRLIPLLPPEGQWESEQEFEEMKNYLFPFRKEIIDMLQQLRERLIA